MDSIFNKWKTKIPNYSREFKSLFESISAKGGAEGDEKISLGKHFSTNYELYIYAFFLGLYKDELSPIPENERKINFSHHIQYWGNKSHRLDRKDFSHIQEYIFTALVAKTDVDLIGLDKGDVSEDEIVKKLLNTLEAYTNGGLILIKEKMEDKSTFFLQPTAFINFLIPKSHVQK